MGLFDGKAAIVTGAGRGVGRGEAIINNAGILRDKTTLHMTAAEWDIVLQIHAKGTFLCSRAAASVMKGEGNGGRL